MFPSSVDFIKVVRVVPKFVPRTKVVTVISSGATFQQTNEKNDIIRDPLLYNSLETTIETFSNISMWFWLL